LLSQSLEGPFLGVKGIGLQGSLLFEVFGFFLLIDPPWSWVGQTFNTESLEPLDELLHVIHWRLRFLAPLLIELAERMLPPMNLLVDGSLEV
jgi:hypothetical protein